MKTYNSLPLAELTPPGELSFKELIAEAPSMDIRTLKARIYEIASNKDMAVATDTPVNVSLFPVLTTRRETAVLAKQIIDDAGIDASPGQGREMLLSWLALIFLPTLCKRNTQGCAQPNNFRMYIQSRSSSDSYRHLVAGPYFMHATYPDTAHCFLSQAATTHPNIAEQFMSRPSLLKSPAVVDLTKRLYWDNDLQQMKPSVEGYTTIAKPPPGMPVHYPDPGTLLALESILSQIECTYDLRSISTEQLIDKLPTEFSSWLVEEGKA